MKKEYIIPIFIPFLGCPHDCAFCNQVKITNYKDKMDKDKLVKEIEENLSYFPEASGEKEIAFFGGSFTGLDRDTMIDYLKIAKSYKDRGIINKIRLSTRPDYINNSILDILKFYEVDVIELGIQSLDQEVLDKNERGHRVEDSYEASRLIKSYGFSLGHQIMPGLYGYSDKEMIDTALKSAKIGPDMVRVYPTLVIKDTKLEKLYKAGLYKPLSLDEAVRLSAECLMIYSYYDIPVIRIGLQPTENINDNKDVVAGPFHPAMRQLVESYIYRTYIEKIIKENDLRGDIIVRAKDRDISMISGNKKSNKKYFYDEYGIDLSFESSDIFFISQGDRQIGLNLDRFMASYVEEKYGGDRI